MKFLSTIALSLLALGTTMAQRAEFTRAEFDFTAKKNVGETLAVTPQTIYSEETGYGYDVQPAANSEQQAAWDSKSVQPFFFSVNVPDGNYRITVTLGNRRAKGETTVRAESRRLFILNQETAKGKTYTKSFVVNKRNINYTNAKGEQTRVKIKDREKYKLNWDDKLTLEFNGAAPCVQHISIEPADVPTLYLCGNSTVVDQDYEPWASWGQMITYYLDDQVAVANYAESGETAEGFIARGRLAKIVSLMKEGDYLFMEFGHNDQKTDKQVGHGAFYHFQHNLKEFVDLARQKGATPVFCTPTRRRHFDAENHIKDTHVDYPEAMRFMANREQLPLIELQDLTKVMYEAWGPQESTHAFVHYPANTYPGQDKALADDTHFNPFGAMQIAKLVLQGMRDAHLPVADHILPTFTGFDAAHPEVWTSFHWAESPLFEVAKPDGN